ncbi:MAG TPA: PQQ-binding-like beta-propeller repeat protein [Planctomycetota bacterium]|nr:PQQ-binding-like beta-propeller repeat protein [Planctomycetota bacterium]
MDLLKFLENQKVKLAVGNLTLGRKNNFREVFFEGGSVYMVGDNFSGKVAVSRLIELKILGTTVSFEKLETMIVTMHLAKRLLPHALFEEGLINEEQFRLSAEEHIREELIDLLIRISGSFHFQDGRVPESLLKGDEITARIPVQLADVLSEMKRRLTIMAKFDLLVPSHEEIFVLTEKGMAAKQERKDDLVLQRVFDLIDGLRDMQSILSDTYFFAFPVISLIAKSLEDGLVKKTIHPELKGLSTHTFTRQDAEHYLPYYKNAVKYGVDELAARERLAVLYEKVERAEEAVIQYNFIGDAMYRMHQSGKAIKAYQRALQLRPGEILITDKITRIYREAAAEELEKGNIDQAIQFFQDALLVRPEAQEIFSDIVLLLIKERKLTDLAALCDRLVIAGKKMENREMAIHACRHIILQLPRNAAFRKKIINLYVDFGMIPEASMEMQVLARQYLERGQMPKAREMLEKMRRVGAGLKETRDLELQMTGPQMRKRSHATLRIFSLFTLFFLFYQAWGFYIWSTLRNTGAVAEAAVHEVANKSSYEASVEEIHAVELARKCEAFVHDFPASLFRGEAQALGSKLKVRVEQLHSTRVERIRAALLEARKNAIEGERDLALKALKPVLALGSDDPFHAEAEALALQVNKHPQSARDLHDEAEELKLHKDWKGVFRTYRKLVTTYPQSKLSAGIQLPVLLKSRPPGAIVLEVVGPETRKPLGATPHVVWLPSGETLQIEVTAEGHATIKSEVSEADGGEKVLVLPRKPRWVKNIDGALAAPPTIADRVVICGTSKGTVISLNASTGEPFWPEYHNAGQSIVAPAVLTGDRLFTVWSDRRVLVMTAVSSEATPAAGNRLHVSADIPLPSLASTSIHLLSGSPLFVIGTLSGELHAYHAETGAHAWSLALEAVAVEIRDLERDLLVTTAKGQLLRVQTDPRRVVWRNDTVCPDGILQAMPLQTNVLAVTRRNDFIYLDLVTGKAQPGVPILVNVTLHVNPRERKVFAIDRSGTISLLSPETAKPLNSQALKLHPPFATPLPGALVVLREDRKGFVVVDSERLEVSWTAEAKKIITVIAGNEKHIVSLTEDGKLSLYGR